MNTLSSAEKETILNFYFRCGTQEEIEEGRDLIAKDPRAAQLYSSLEETLTQLDHVKYEPCPDNLAELTIARLKLASSSGKTTLSELLEIEKNKSNHNVINLPNLKQQQRLKEKGFWRNMAEVAAVAAVILVLTGFTLPTLSYMRQKAGQVACAGNLAGLFGSLQAYSADNDNCLPAVSIQAGSPWYKVGQEDTEKNVSNTRHLWLLVQKGYAKPDSFICKSRKTASPLEMTKEQIKNYFDFPERENVSYSFTFVCDEMDKRILNPKKIILADLNPIFEQIFSEKDPPENIKIQITEDMLNWLSRNHNQKGQNVLFRDGSVEFEKTRIIYGDDIYTLKNATIYNGTEIPEGTDDTFLAP
jgi:hypothetical protein